MSILRELTSKHRWANGGSERWPTPSRRQWAGLPAFRKLATLPTRHEPHAPDSCGRLVHRRALVKAHAAHPGDAAATDEQRPIGPRIARYLRVDHELVEPDAVAAQPLRLEPLARRARAQERL